MISRLALLCLSKQKSPLQSLYYFNFCTQDTEALEKVRSTVFQVLRSAAKCKQDKLTEQASFEELGFDSLDSVEMVVALEENFGFDVTNEEAEKITGVNDAVAVFYKHYLLKLNAESVVEQKEPQK